MSSVRCETDWVYDTLPPANSLRGHLVVLPTGLVVYLADIRNFYFTITRSESTISNVDI